MLHWEKAQKICIFSLIVMSVFFIQPLFACLVWRSILMYLLRYLV